MDAWRKCGDIMSFSLTGHSAAVMIFNYEMMKEVFIQNADYVSNRPINMWLLNQLSKQKGKNRILKHHTIKYFNVAKACSKCESNFYVDPGRIDMSILG